MWGAGQSRQGAGGWWGTRQSPGMARERPRWPRRRRRVPLVIGEVRDSRRGGNSRPGMTSPRDPDRRPPGSVGAFGGPPRQPRGEGSCPRPGASRHREGLGWGGGRPLRGLRPTAWAGCASPIDSGRVSPGPLSGHQKQDANEFPATLGPRGGGSRPPHCPSGGQLAFLPPRGNLRRAPGLVRDSGGRRQPKYR